MPYILCSVNTCMYYNVSTFNGGIDKYLNLRKVKKSLLAGKNCRPFPVCDHHIDRNNGCLQRLKVAEKLRITNVSLK